MPSFFFYFFSFFFRRSISQLISNAAWAELTQIIFIHFTNHNIYPRGSYKHQGSKELNETVQMKILKMKTPFLQINFRRIGSLLFLLLVTCSINDINFRRGGKKKNKNRDEGWRAAEEIITFIYLFYIERDKPLNSVSVYLVSRINRLSRFHDLKFCKLILFELSTFELYWISIHRL